MERVTLCIPMTSWPRLLNLNRRFELRAVARAFG
jgi:hypothetical protein